MIHRTIYIFHLAGMSSRKCKYDAQTSSKRVFKRHPHSIRANLHISHMNQQASSQHDLISSQFSIKLLMLSTSIHGNLPKNHGPKTSICHARNFYPSHKCQQTRSQNHRAVVSRGIRDIERPCQCTLPNPSSSSSLLSIRSFVVELSCIGVRLLRVLNILESTPTRRILTSQTSNAGFSNILWTSHVSRSHTIFIPTLVSEPRGPLFLIWRNS